ncbi:MAG TPA: hypothetical protein VLY24_15985 [Bryobacteraceae bacterium]|nr:hypothetical protein [Bryobacteraceae bacterium]
MGESGTFQLFRLPFDVKLEFVFQIALHAVAPHDRAQPVQKIADHPGLL